jgi:hypothetical protein
MGTYACLLDIKLKHNYYSSGDTSDLSISVSSEAKEIMRQHGLMARTLKGSFTVPFKTTGTIPHTSGCPLSNGTHLFFLIAKQNDVFQTVTDLTDKTIANRDKVYLFKNVVGSSELQKSLIDIYPKRFGYSFTDVINDQLELEIYDQKDDLVSSLSALANDDGEYEVNFDLGKLPEGKYTIKHKVDVITVIEEHTIYLFDEYNKAAHFGIIDIEVSEDLPLDYANGDNYTITFEPKKTQWKYFVVVPEIIEQDSFSISDENDFPTGVTLDSNEYPEITFPAGVQVDDTDGKKTFLFTSDDTDIPIYQKPKLNLNLIRQKSGGGATSTLIENLPRPGLTNLNSEVYIYINRNVY